MQTSVSWLNFNNPHINEHLCSGICRLNCSNEDCHTVLLTILLTQCWNYHVTKCHIDHCIKYHYMQCLLFIVLENKCVLTTGFSGHLKQGCVHKGHSGLVVKCSGPKWLASGYWITLHACLVYTTCSYTEQFFQQKIVHVANTNH